MSKSSSKARTGDIFEKALRANIEAVRELIAFLDIPESEIIELQALGGGPPMRIFVRAKDLHTAFPLPSYAGIYMIYNPIKEWWVKDKPKGWHVQPKDGGTSNIHMAGIRVLIFDCDADRANGVAGGKISATDAEKERARALSVMVREKLLALGVPENSIATIDSGNGFYIAVTLETMPVDHIGLISRCMQGMKEACKVDGAEVDTSVDDAKNLYALPGSMKGKGLHSLERPHRPVTIEAPGLPLKVALA